MTLLLVNSPAEAVQEGQTPEISVSLGAQVFRDMRVQDSYLDCTAEQIRSVLGPLANSKAASGAHEASQVSLPAQQEPPKAAESAAQGSPSASQPAVIKAQPDLAAGSSEASRQGDGHFAPLTGKDAVSGAQRVMPGGKKGYFW